MIKVSVFSNKRIIIENYKSILDISDNKIIVDQYNILGSNLSIKLMNKHMLDIYGVVNNIEISS